MSSHSYKTFANDTKTTIINDDIYLLVTRFQPNKMIMTKMRFNATDEQQVKMLSYSPMTTPSPKKEKYISTTYIY